MASIQKRNVTYRVRFRYLGQPFDRSLRTQCEKKAIRAKNQIEQSLELVALGILTVPKSCDVFMFLLSGGKTTSGVGESSSQKKKKTKVKCNISFFKLIELYFKAFLTSSIEENSYGMLQTHKNNLLRLVGKKTKVRSISTATIQTYINKRAKEKGRRGKVEPVTIRKEVTTLTAMLKWAKSNGYIKEIPSREGIRYPKGKEKQPFQTWKEIERKVLSGISKNEAAELWECLYLTTNQISELLEYVKTQSMYQFVYPMFVFAAHTGVTCPSERCQFSM